VRKNLVFNKFVDLYSQWRFENRGGVRTTARAREFWMYVEAWKAV